jgi:hypothetical protein
MKNKKRSKIRLERVPWVAGYSDTRIRGEYGLWRRPGSVGMPAKSDNGPIRGRVKQGSRHWMRADDRAEINDAPAYFERERHVLRIPKNSIKQKLSCAIITHVSTRTVSSPDPW